MMEHNSLDNSADASGVPARSAASFEDIDPAILVETVNALRRAPASARFRVAQAALTFLGVTPEWTSSHASMAENAVSVSSDSPTVTGLLPRRVSIWMSQNDLIESDLESIFHFSPSGVEVIAHTVPGRSNRERVRFCYLLAGLKSFIGTGEPRFSDDAAREICRDLGCYDKANHATYVKAIGNLIVGSKSSTFELTQPGLKAAGELARELRGGTR